MILDALFAQGKDETAFDWRELMPVFRLDSSVLDRCHEILSSSQGYWAENYTSVGLCVRAVHSRDVREGYGRILIPYALWKEKPSRARAWQWQYVFPASRRSRDPRKGAIRRHHVSLRTIQRRLRNAVARAGIEKPVSCACLRRSFGFHMLATGTEPELVQELLGYKSAKTLRSQMPKPVRLGGAVGSPLDLLTNV